MRTRRVSLALLLLLAAPALADVVTLTSGRTISGTVITENEKEVVIKTPDGKVTLPRALVASVTRQGRGETQLSLARERATAGAYEDAARLYEQAAQDPDARIARQAREELAAMQARIESARRHRPPPSTPLPLPEGTTGEPVEGNTLQDQLDRARRAIETGDHARARRLLEPLAAGNPTSKPLAYLLGRALEGTREEVAACERYRFVLGGAFTGAAHPAAWLGELARRALSGEEVTLASPGAGAPWKRIETEHFALYHAFSQVEPWLSKEPEDALADVIERLGIQERELRLAGRVQVFVFLDGEHYQRDGGGERFAGHAQSLVAPDGVLKVIKTYPTRSVYRNTFRHEVAHAVLFDLYPALPLWAHEGAASFTETQSSRGRRRGAFAASRRERKLQETLAFLGARGPAGESMDELRAYYAQALVTFEALCELRDGPREALNFLRKVQRDGAEKALESSHLTVAMIDTTADRLAADQSVGSDD